MRAALAWTWSIGLALAACATQRPVPPRVPASTPGSPPARPPPPAAWTQHQAAERLRDRAAAAALAVGGGGARATAIHRMLVALGELRLARILDEEPDRPIDAARFEVVFPAAPGWP